MGCDIHLIVEVKRGDGAWHRVDPPEEDRDEWLGKQVHQNPTDRWYNVHWRKVWFDDRNYNAFAILADVRNGYGFAGVKTGDGFEPISGPRGWPHDLSEEGKKWVDDGGSDNDDLWPGDHSFSWVTLQELLDYDWTRKTEREGVIKQEEWLNRMATGDASRPDSFSGGIFGGGITTIDEREEIPAPEVTAGKAVYVRTYWKETYAEASGRLYSKLMPALQRLAVHEGVEPSAVRLVFGFDS